MTPAEEIIAEHEQYVREVRAGFRDAARILARVVLALVVLAVFGYVSGLIGSIR